METDVMKTTHWKNKLYAADNIVLALKPDANEAVPIEMFFGIVAI